ncbi:MAG: 30S ribosomal protein S6 [bacterium]
MRLYETVFILDPKLDEKQVSSEIDRVKNLITNFDGDIVDVEQAGKKKLAYEIDGNREGYYILIRFKSSPSSISELEQSYRLNERVLRHVIIRVADEDELQSGKTAS